MADYTDSKEGLGGQFHDNAVEVGWDAKEPLITPAQLRMRHLWGLNLYSAQKDPITGKPAVMDDPTLKEFIKEAVSLAEIEANIDIFPRQYTEKHAFDKAAHDSFGYMVLRHRPVYSIELLEMTPANEEAIFSVPLDWVDVGYLHQGQINLIPLTLASQAGSAAVTSTGGALFLTVFGHRHWIPSFWECKYTSGFKDMELPRALNQLVGVVAAMEVLSMLATTKANTNSTSLSFDGLSQSVSTPGADIYTPRLRELGEKRKWLCRKIQRAFGLGLMSNNV